MVAILAGALGILGGVIGSYASLHANDQSLRAEAVRQSAEFREQRDDQARQKRGDVYAAYLDAAESYSSSDYALFQDGKKLLNGQQMDSAIIQTFIDDRSKYQGAINQLYVYGSDNAWRAHERLAATMPPSLGALNLFPVDTDKYTAAYRGFQKVMCQEVPAEPRTDC